MGIEEAIVPAIPVVLGSWVAMVTACAAYLFTLQTRLSARIERIETDLVRAQDIVSFVSGLGDQQTFMQENSDPRGDASDGSS